MSYPGGGNAPAWASMPMPAGWEAKYDGNSGRYFFINHQLRSTQWVDPRKAIYEAQQRSPRMPYQPVQQQIPMVPITKPKCRNCKVNDVDSAGQTCQACKVQQQQREISLMRAREQMEEEKKRQEQQARLQKERERRRVQSAKRREENASQAETSFNNQSGVGASSLSIMDKVTMKNDLGGMFPNITDSVISMVLESCDWDKGKAIEVLISMGGETGGATKTTSAPKSSPAKIAAKSSPAKAAAKSPAKPKAAELSAAKKKEIQGKFKSRFPNATEGVILMALESTNYNMVKATEVMKMVKDSGDTGAGTSAKASTSKAAFSLDSGERSVAVTFPESSSTTDTVTTSGGASSSWVITFPETATTATTSQSSARTNTTTTTIILTAPAVSVPKEEPKRSPSPSLVASPKKKATTAITAPKKKAAAGVTFGSKVAGLSSTSGVSKQMAPKKSTKKSPSGSKSGGGGGAPFPSSSSDSQVKANGPDPSLPKGPNLDNLLNDYVSETGPNTDLSKGPDPQNVEGPQEKTGQDKTMVTGPDPSNAMGPQSGLAKGPMHTSIRQC